MCFELLCDVPGEFPFVNHGFGHGQKGGIGFLVVDAQRAQADLRTRLYTSESTFPPDTTTATFRPRIAPRS